MTSELIINLAAISENIQRIRSHLPAGTRIMAVLKGGTYGIGRPVEMANRLRECGVDIFGFAFVDEAAELRDAGIQEDLFVLMPRPDEASKARGLDLQVAASDMRTLKAYEKSGPVKIHLNINTGMNRLGCLPHEAPLLAEYIQASPNLKLEGVMSHLAGSEDPAHDAFTLQQIQVMIAMISSLKEAGVTFPWTHISNSAGAARFARPEFNMVRIGLIMYGIHLSRQMRQILPLKPALTLKSRIAAINRLNKNDSVSYGRTYKAPKDNTLVAVVPLGYFDGLHRCYSNRAEVLVKGRKAKIVGAVCMDFMMIDVTGISEVCVDDVVTIFGIDECGNEQTAEEFAASGGTIAHELITCMGPRIKRTFTQLPAPAFQVQP